MNTGGPQAPIPVVCCVYRDLRAQEWVGRVIRVSDGTCVMTSAIPVSEGTPDDVKAALGGWMMRNNCALHVLESNS